MNGKTAFFLLVVVSLLSSPGVATADEIKITPSVAVEERYTDNLFFDEGNKTDDLITKVMPRLEFSRRSERYTGRLSGGLERWIYADTQDFDATDGRIEGEFSYRFTPRLNASATIQYARTSQNDRDLETTGMLLTQSDRNRYAFLFSSEYQLSEKASASLSYSYRQDDYSAADKNDYTSHTISAELSRNISEWFPRTVAFANAGGTLADYARIPAYEFATRVPWPVFPAISVADTVQVQTDETNDVESCRLTAGIQHALSETLSLVAYAGLSHTRQEQTVRQDLAYGNYPVYNRSISSDAVNAGFGYLASISLNFSGEKSSGDFGLTHDVVDSGANAQTLNRTSVSAGWNRQFTADIRGGVKTRYFINKSSEDSISSDPVNEATLTVSASLAYAFSDRWAFGLGVSHTDLNDEAGGTRKKRNMLFFRVTYAFPLVD